MSEVRFPLGPEAISQYRQARLGLRNYQGDARRQASRDIQRGRRLLVQDYTEQILQRALRPAHSTDEALVWFWFNHFNVFWAKDLVGVALPDYVDNVIRPNVRGRFRDLLLGTMTHPAMLVYLDNARNVKGRINENYARELLELHTLGVDGGYTQADVREAARVLTGLGLRPVRPMQLNRTLPRFQPLVRERGEFVFDPARHESGAKVVLGRRLEGAGFAEVEALVDLLVGHPATARHIAGRLCRYLLGDGAPAATVTRAAAAFAESGGDLARTVSTIEAAAGTKRGRTFKDPYRYVLSAVALLSGEQGVSDARPVARWLSLLGQPLFGCRTPDGYSLDGQDWVNAGQMTQRFELAREMVGVVPRIAAQPVSAEAVLARPAAQALLAGLGPASRAALARAGSGEERLALLLASPEFMYW